MKNLMKTVKTLSAVALVGAMASWPGAGASAQEITLEAGTSMPKVFPLAFMFTDFLKPRIEKYSNGRIKLNVHLAKSLCVEKTCVEQVKLGQTDMATVSVANYGGFGRTFEVLTLPYIFKDTPSAQKVLDGFLAEELRKLGEKNEGLKVLAIVPMLGFRNLEHNAGVIRTPKDLKGIKIRVTKSPLDGALLRAWGAVATPVAWGETYDAVQQKVVRGLYIQKAVYVAMKFNEVAPSVTETGGAFTPMMFFMDLKRFNKLPGWAQKAIQKAADELQRDAFEIDGKFVTKFEKGLIKAKAAGKVKHYIPTADELKLWRTAAAQAWLVGKKMGLYDAKQARRILEAQSGQEDFIAELERIGAL